MLVRKGKRGSKLKRGMLADVTFVVLLIRICRVAHGIGHAF